MAASAVSTSHFLPSLRANPPSSSSSSSSSSYCFTNSRCLKNNPLVSHGRRGRMMEARMSMGMEHIVGGMDVDAALERAQGFLYTIADAAVVATDQASSAPVKNNGWFGFLADGMEEFLKVLKNGLTTVHVPYAYGFAIITLTVLVKVATFPLTKKQVESTIAMQNLQPKLSAIQKRYGSDKERVQLETARLYKQAGVNPLAGCLPTLATMPVWIGLYQALSNVANEGLLTEGFFWIPSLAGPTTIAARQSGSGISWLFPFVDGHPPLGWPETISYLILPMLLIGSQYVSMQVLQPPQSNDPSQKNAQVVLKFLPFLLGYFSLSVPSGLTLYWLTNNVLSTGQQVWLRKLGGAKPVVNKDGNGIISAGQAKRSALTAIPDIKEADRAERFRQRKAEEEKRKIGSGKQDVDANGQNVYQSTESSIGQMDREGESISEEKDSLDEIYVAGGNGTPVSNSALKRSKRAKRSRTAKRS